MPKVSVIIPSYNHERFVKECIQSVLNQTFQDFEIVITDDASSDRTVQIIRGFQDPRIKLYVQDRNRGVAVAANRCVCHSSGDYIAWLSSDDAWVPQALELEVNSLEQHPEIGAVFGKVAWIDGLGQPITDERLPFLHVFDVENRGRYAWLRQFFYEGNCLNIPSSLVRRECFDRVGLFNPCMANLPDLDLWVRICLQYDIHVLDEALVRSRRVGEDSNASGDNPASRRRTRFEHKQLMDHYLGLKTVEQVLATFPQARTYGQMSDDLLPYFIARAAIDAKAEFIKAWGLEVLFRFLQDENMTHKVEQQCGFTPRDLIELTGRVDVFNIGAVEAINASGRRWRIVSAVSRVLTGLVPPGSQRERSIRSLERALRKR